MLVPLFTPPLDTAVGAERRTIQLVDVKLTDGGKYEFGFDKLRQWVKLADRSGLEYFEFSHFFTQWGAEHCPKIVADINGKSEIIFGWKDDSLGEDYYSFLSQLAAALKPVIRELGIEERCIFHVSDEPDTAHLQRYKACAAVIHDLFGEFKIIDALSNYSFYSSGAIRIPVPSVAHASEFYGKVEELWCYYCCGPIDGGYTNRFIAMPGTRTRALGIQAYKHNVRGFLHWGYNYWYTALSKYKINPYISPDADKSFPAGDGFVVYPGEELSPVLSLRLKIFDDAFNDLSALKLLESLLSREEVLSILEEKKEITFSKYPQTERGLFELRERINRAIGETIQTPQSN